jgi:hypothetical protein
MLKILLFAAGAIPLVLFMRSIFFRRPTRISESFKELKKQFDFAVSLFLCLIATVVVFALGHLAWSWWTAP